MVEANGQQNPEPAAQLSGMQATLRLVPHRLLLAALDHPTALSAIPARTYRGDSLDGARHASGAGTLSLYFDRLAGSLVMVETVTDDPVLGNRRRATIYTRWTPTGAIKFPRSMRSPRRTPKGCWRCSFPLSACCSRATWSTRAPQTWRFRR